MKQTILVACIIIICINLCAQKTLSIDGVKVKEKNIYFLLDKSNIKYFTKDQGPDAGEPLGSSKTFSLKSNYSNIYFQWMNPLKYRLTWKDTLMNDDRDQAINDFVKLLVAQFGTSVTDLNNEPAKNAAVIKNAIGEYNLIIPAKMNFPSVVFNNKSLNSLFVDFFLSKDTLKEDVTFIANIYKDLQELDALNATNISKKVDDIFQSLISLTDQAKVETTLHDYSNGDLARYDAMFKRIESLQTSIQNQVTSFNISIPIINSYAQVVITQFLEKTAANMVKNKNLLAKLKPIFELIQSSLLNKSANFPDYYLVRNISFDNGKMMSTILTIDEFEYKPATIEYVKHDQVLKTSLTFKKYDLFAISTSTGIFYSNTTLKGYGVATSGDQFMVTEADIEKSSPVTALFLNFNLSIGSRYLSPLLQLGIDPTKRRPFLLAGGGFSIPASNIAFSGGPIWTWNQSLGTLEIGSTIKATTDLEKDIHYKFDIAPKGWYLGIQYNF